MVRKTISLDDALFQDLDRQGMLDRFKNFSELVSNALRSYMEKQRKEEYRRQIAAAAADPMVQADVEEIEEAFRFADGEQRAV